MIALVLGAVFLLMALVGGLDQFAGCLLPFAWLDHPAQKIMLVAMRTECVEHE